MLEGKNVHFTPTNKPLCSFSGKLCNLRRLNGYAFCVRHILEDTSAPFKQCVFVVKNSGSQCTSPIPNAEEREYCNAHMQVLGKIPKKERRKKTESTFLSEGTGIPNIGSFKLPNGCVTESDSKHGRSFSASKMFPELAGKLSLDNQKHSESATGDLSNKSTKKTPPKTATSNAASTNKTPPKTATSNATSTNKTPPKTATSNATGSRRSRKPTKKYLSILRKKQLGLLTDQEAKACLTPSGCKTYSHYVRLRTAGSHLLTPIIDSSDDDTMSSSLLIAHNLTNSCSPFTSYSTDLNADLSDSDPCDYDNLFRLKQTCFQMKQAAKLNDDMVQYTKSFTGALLETVKDNLKGAVFLINKIGNPSKIARPPDKYVPESRIAQENRRWCVFEGTEKKRCNQRTIPMSRFCIKHIKCSGDQKLFSSCTFACKVVGEDSDDTRLCGNAAIDFGHAPALCLSHTPRAVDPFALEQEMNLRRKKKKNRPFSNRRSKKRRKVVRPQKPVPSTNVLDRGRTAPSSSSSSSVLSTVRPAAAATIISKGFTSPAAVGARLEDSDGELDSDTENILSSLDRLPLDHDASKILDDDEIDEVLNEENFNIFSESDKNDGLELTEADADLIFNAADEVLLDNLKELPDDITDAILHVEYEAELEKQQQQQQHDQYVHHHHQQQQQQRAHHMLNSSSSGVYNINSYPPETTDYHSTVQQQQQQMQQQQSYNHPGPPPDYPGATKLLSTSHITHNNHNNISYIHEQNFSHHPIHSKMAAAAPNNNQQMLIRQQQQQQSNYHLSPASPLSLPSSSNHLNTAHMPMNRLGRLPPVSTITNTMPWHSSEPARYQNGFHSPTEHHIAYQPHNGLPSPPLYSREQRMMYNSPLYNNGIYGMNHALRPAAHPQHVNMSLQQ